MHTFMQHASFHNKYYLHVFPLNWLHTLLRKDVNFIYCRIWIRRGMAYWDRMTYPLHCQVLHLLRISNLVAAGKQHNCFIQLVTIIVSIFCIPYNSQQQRENAKHIHFLKFICSQSISNENLSVIGLQTGAKYPTHSARWNFGSQMCRE